MRTDGRNLDQLRNVSIETDFTKHAEGSALIKMGDTHVLCNASYETSVPKWLSGSNKGWVSAEYGMIPRSTHQRMKRERTSQSGRSQEISRLIGRSLRAAIDLSTLGERQITIDCDVLQADGGTRTAAITGGYVALFLSLKFLHDKGEIKDMPVLKPISAISIGLRHNDLLLDLNYDEDSTIDTDMNFVMDNGGRFIEIQGTAEGETFSQEHMVQMMKLATKGCQELFEVQEKALKR